MKADGQSNGMSRRRVLGSAGAMALTPALSYAHATAHSSLQNTLWYKQPARRWEEALPLGNGRLGAMVFGRVAQERLQLNEDTLWSGGPYTPDNPEAYGALNEVRGLIADGKFKEATDLASRKMMAKPLSQMAYGTLGDLLLTFGKAKAPSHYERLLDLETATATTRITDSSSSHTREVFVSVADQVVVVRLVAEKGRIAFDANYRGPRKVNIPFSVFQGDASNRDAESPVDWMASETVDPANPDVKFIADGPDALLITGHNEGTDGVAGKLTYALRVKVVSDGQTSVGLNGISVQGAKVVTLLVAAATSFVAFNDVSGDPVAKVRAQCEAASKKSYADLKRAHIDNHQRLFKTVSLRLGSDAAASKPTDARIISAATTDDPALHALYFQYARYLLISSSRRGTQAANLQGIWNQSTNPPWGSKYTININTEMNYWPADPAGLSDCVEPLIRLVEELSVTGTKTASTMYEARGWVAHHNTDIWRAAAPIDGPMWGLWPCGGAWLCNSLWDHYDYTRDEALPPRLYPLLKGASQFFVDTLIEDPGGRGLVTSPSVSPENQHPYGSSLCAGPAMDRQIVRDLFAHTMACGHLLGVDSDWLETLKSVHGRLAPDRIGKQGQLQEWLEDWDAQAPEQQHRHVSHLYGVYPSDQINVRDTPDLLMAAKRSLIQRGDMATGWGTAWRLCLWARMGEGEHAYSVLKGLVGPKRTYPNMFDAHPPFQIDGNFGGAAGILEMLVQSWGGEIRLLPALPSAWPSGEVKGVKARGAVTIDLAWDKGKLTSCHLKGRPGSTVRVLYQNDEKSLVIGPEGVVPYRING